MNNKETLIHQRVREAREGSNPRVIGRMASGWAVVGDHQIVYGYSLLLPDPVVPSINHLGEADRTRYLADMVLLGDALLAVTGAHRINYEILGNSEPALHVHLFPRHETEPDDLRIHPVWYYDWSLAKPLEAEKQQHFIEQVNAELNGLGALI